MQPTKLRTLSELPDWFDLGKYANAHKLDALGWFEQYVTRANILAHLDCDQPKQVQTLLKIMRHNPLISLTDEDLILESGGRKLLELKRGFQSKQLHDIAGVREMSVRSFCYLERHLDKEKKRHADNLIIKYSRDPTYSQGADYPDWFDQPVSKVITDEFQEHWETRCVPLTIDLTNSDPALIEQFEHFLKNIRQPSSAQRVRTPTSKQWIEFGILPYIDLILWAKENKFILKNRLIADAVFAPGEGGEEVVRKTTRKMAAKLLEGSSLGQLASAAAFEFLEK